MPLSRREFLQATALTTIALQTTGVSMPADAATAPTLPYSAGSFFKSTVAGAPVDAAATAAFVQFMTTFVDQKTTPYPLINGLPGNNWGTAYALGTAADPVWRLTGSVPSAVVDLKTTGFHAPEWFGSMLTGTTDSPFVVCDTGSGQSVWGAKARVAAAHTISVGASGRFMHNSNGLDRRNPKSDGPKNFRSRGAIPDAMVIRRDLVDAAIADGTGLGHVLHMFLAETKSADGFCHPMVGAEGSKNGFGAEGLRVAIKPTVDLTTKGLSPFGLVVARTLQQHGAYIGDNSGGASAVKAEQATATRNPWQGLTVSQKALQGLTWADWFVLPRGWEG